MMNGQTDQAFEAVERAITGMEKGELHAETGLPVAPPGTLIADSQDTIAARLRDMGALSSNAVTTTIEQCALRVEAAGQAAVKRAAELNDEAMFFAAALRKHGAAMAGKIDAFAKLTSEVASELELTRSKLIGADE